MQVHEENNAGGEKKKENLGFMQLNLGFFFLSFYLDNEKVDKLTKMDHAAKNMGIELWSTLEDSEKGLERLHPYGLLHRVFHRAAILIQFYFDLCNCCAARAWLYIVYSGLKIMLVDSSLKEIKLPLQFISKPYT